MKHEKYKEFLELNVLGELSQDDEIQLENHLFECSECANEYAQIKKMYKIFTTEGPSIVSENDLLNSRTKLFKTINFQDKQPTFYEKFKEMWNSFFSNNYSIAFGSIVLVLSGMFIGYLIFGTTTGPPKLLTENIIDLDKIDNGDIKIANVNFPEIFSDDGQFEFKLGDSEPVSYKGSLNDVVVQKLLATAINKSENPGFKIKTANTVAELIKSNFVLDDKIKNAFIHTLKTDQNPGVRKGALKALIAFPYDSNIRDVLLFTLTNDDNASNRMDAISTLLAMNFDYSTIDEGLKNKLNKGFVNEDNEVIKYKTTKLLIGGK